LDTVFATETKKIPVLDVHRIVTSTSYSVLLLRVIYQPSLKVSTLILVCKKSLDKFTQIPLLYRIPSQRIPPSTGVLISP